MVKLLAYVLCGSLAVTLLAGCGSTTSTAGATAANAVGGQQARSGIPNFPNGEDLAVSAAQTLLGQVDASTCLKWRALTDSENDAVFRKTYQAFIESGRQSELEFLRDYVGGEDQFAYAAGVAMGRLCR